MRLGDFTNLDAELNRRLVSRIGRVRQAKLGPNKNNAVFLCHPLCHPAA
jgi:hypothetical protein